MTVNNVIGVSINEESKTVRVYNNTLQTYFSFNEYGSREKAIEAAIRYRLHIAPPGYRHKGFTTRITSRNNSGFVGVSMIVCERIGHHGWCASWSKDRKQYHKRFYFGTWGSAAFCMAVEYRDLMIKTLYGEKY